MKHKKLFIIASALFVTSSQVFAGPLSGITNGLANTNFTVFDTPLLNGIEYFIQTISTFSYVAGYLAIVLGLTGVLWNAFRLWFGTQQVRKACIDIGMKFLLYTCILLLYGSITSGVMNLATNLGLNAGNGYFTTRVTLQTMYENVKEQTKAANDALESFYNSIGENGKSLSEDTVRLLAKNTGYSTDELKKKLEESGITVDKTFANAKTVGSGVGTVGGIAGGVAAGAAIGSVIPGVGNVVGALVGGLVVGIGGYFAGRGVGSAIDNGISTNQLYKNAQDTQQKEMLKKIKNGDFKDAFIMMKALDEVISPVTNPDGSISYIYDPLLSLKGTNGTTIKLISPGAIIKTGVLWANLIKNMEATDFDSSAGTFLEKKLDGGFNALTNYIMQLILVIGIIASMIFATIQYVMAIFEYFIVTSMGVIFIPCVLFDGTKTYASKLITLFLSFFVKITVSIMCLFFVINMFATNASVIISSGHPCSLANFAYLFFTIIMGFILTQNAPQIAMTMLNGTPQLSMGEFLHAAGTAAAGAALAKRGASMAANKAAPVIRGANAGIAEGAAAASGAWKGAGEANAGFGTKFKMAASAFAKQTGSAWGSGIKNQTSRFVQGKDSSSHNASSLHVGVGNIKQIKGGETLTQEQQSKAGNNGEVNNNVISAINQNAAKQKAQQIEAEKAKEQPQAGKVSIDGSEQQSNLE
ncbi:type IV secretion system protein [uncultured Treponema sp.]|uniref:type IV secretion system protein n=1 Tax=uncultured Treponema sp. TaxID=162155 RepID=UPI002594ADC8|nr:type IV secretion system protein [uncultured Treponema sp.]